MFCPNCGANVGEAKFCPACGSKLPAPGTVSPVESNEKQTNAKISFNGLIGFAKKGLASIDVETAKEKATQAGEIVSGKANEIKESAMAIKEDINEKLTELDRMLGESITEYNNAYTLMNDKGVHFFVERNRAVDTIGFVENMINSIANRPKSFESDFEDIKTNRDTFLGCCDFGMRELKAAREAAGGAGAGIAAGATVAFMAPTAAMWIATTFGTASTGTAISTLSGAAATKAALAWLGGGAISAGGGGVAAGNALLAMAGPIGWTIAGATLLTTIVLFTSKRTKLNKQKNEEIESVKKNTVIIKEMDAQISTILRETIDVRTGLNGAYMQCLDLYGKDYNSFTDEQKKKLGSLVNYTKTLSAMFSRKVEPIEAQDTMA